MTRHRRILGDGFWVAVGQAGTGIGQIVGIRVLTELLPFAAFGEVSLLIGIWALVRTVFVTSVGNAALRYFPEMAVKGEAGLLRRAAGELMRRSLAVPALGILVAGAIAAIVAGAGPASFVLLALLLVTEGWRAYEVNFLAAARRQKAAALLDAAETLSRPLIYVPMIRILGPVPEAVLLSVVLVNALLLLVIRLFVARDGAGEAGGTPGEIAALRGELGRYALPLMPKAAVLWVSSMSDRFIIRTLRGVDAVGTYAPFYALMSQPFLLGQEVIARTLTPSYFLAVSQRNELSERKIFRTLLLGTIALCASGIVLVVLFRPLIAALVLAPSYRESSGLMIPLALGNAVLAVEYVFERKLFAHKRTKEIFAIQVVGATASIAATVPLVALYGVWGAAMACPLYYSIQLGFAAWRASR